ncbi:MAG: flavodoxin family protein [Methanomassiliicoccales archaeon]|nr:flavodoxin family protein [Methanomassiliicoccales archaeon]
MKVIGIVGSPRKNGCTDTLVKMVLEGAAENGHETKKYDLNTMKYSGCKACMYCKGHDHCSQKDDASVLMKDIQEADAVVFGSPVYFSQFTGQFRSMQDRMFVFFNSDLSPRLSPGKKTVIVMSQGNPDPAIFEGLEKTLEQTLGMAGFQMHGKVHMGGGNDPKEIMKRGDLLDKAKDLGRTL